MNLRKFFLLISVLLSVAPSYGTNPTATEKLWKGIAKSNVRLVQQAINEGADLSKRASPYGDTPLAAAIRIYCHTLIARSSESKSSLPTIGMRTGPISISSQQPKSLLSSRSLAISAALLTWVAAHYMEKDKSPFLPILMLGAFVVAEKIPIRTTPASVKVVALLIDATDGNNARLRNKEGLSALEILNSYFPYAYQTQDEHWYKFSYLLLKKGN